MGSPAPQLTTYVRATAEPRGCAVFLPGFLDTGDGPAARAVARALSAVGLTTVSYDPRGTGASPGEPADCAPSVQLVDLAALVDRYAVGSRLVLVGHCYGGLLAMVAAAGLPRVTDVVAIMPTRCFIWPEDYDVAKDTWRVAGQRSFLRTDPGSGTVRRYEVPYRAVTDALTVDLPAALRRLRQRILFVAGADDEVVPVAAVARLYDECGSRDTTMEMLAGVGHDFRDDPRQLGAVCATVADWVDRPRRIGVS